MTHRPLKWDDYIGQEKLKRRLALHARGAEARGEPMPHVLLIGPPGCGKTTLARLIAQDVGADYESFMMPISETLLRSFVEEYRGVVLFDELHRSTPKQQESLLTLVEDGYLQLPNGAKIFNDGLTIIGATTEGDRIIKPLFDRFPVKPIFDEYTDEEMFEILKRFASREAMEIDESTLQELAPACLGVPRNARQFVQTAVDLWFQGENVPTTDTILQVMRITPEGLTAEHQRYCKMLATAGGQAGLDLMKTLLGLPARAVEDLEIDLLKQGLLKREKSGRILTSRGYQVAGNGPSRFGTRARKNAARTTDFFRN